MSQHTTPSEELRPVKQSFCVSLRQDTHCKSLILSMLIYICLAAILWCRWTVISEEGVNIYDELSTQMSEATPCNNAYIYIPIAFFSMLWLLYLVECWNSHTRFQLQHKVDGNMIYERVRDMRDAQPIVWWKAVCYHYVRRTRQVTRYRNGDAFTTTQVYYERVNSHAAGSAFNYASCGVNDLTRVLVGLDRYPATKIRFTKGFSFATLEAEDQFEEQRSQFFEDNERRDDYMESQEGMDLLNIHFKEYMIAFADPDNLPWYVSHIIFWIASLLFLTWPLRVIIDYKTAYVHVHIHKVFGCDCIDDHLTNGSQGGELSRVSTMGSSEMEMTIRNNYSIVPSYSEALLIQSSSDKFAYLLRRPTPAGGGVVKPKRSLTFSSLSNALTTTGSRNCSFVRGSCSNGYLSATTRDARFSNYIIANHGNSSRGSICQLNSNGGEKEDEDCSASPSDAQIVDEITMRPPDKHRSQNRRQRKTTIHSCCPFTHTKHSRDPATANNNNNNNNNNNSNNNNNNNNNTQRYVTTSPNGVTQPLDDPLRTREPSSHLQLRSHDGRCDHELYGNRGDHFCMVADAPGVADADKDTTAAIASATAEVERNDYGHIYENAPLLRATNGSCNRNAFHPICRPISNRSISPEQYPHPFPSTKVLPPDMAHNEISGCNNTARSDATNNIDNKLFSKRDIITGSHPNLYLNPNPNPNPNVNHNPNRNINFNPNPIYTNITYTFQSTGTATISSDVICCSSGGSCLHTSQIPQGGQFQTGNESPIEAPHQEHASPDDTGRITVIVRNETPRKHSSVEVIHNSSLTQRNQQLTLRPYLSLNKPNNSSSNSSSSSSSNSSSRPGINNGGGDIKGSYVGGRPNYLIPCNAGSNGGAGCSVGDCSVVGACSDNTSVEEFNSSGSNADQVEHPKPRHLWENNGRRQFLPKDRNFTCSIDIETDSTPSSSRSSMCEQAASAIPKHHHDHFRENQQRRCHHHGNSGCKSTVLSSSSLGRQAPATNLQDDPDPPPSYEDAIWMQRFTSRNCARDDGDDDDHHHHHRRRSNSFSQDSTSRNQRPHKTIKLMETSI